MSWIPIRDYSIDPETGDGPIVLLAEYKPGSQITPSPWRFEVGHGFDTFDAEARFGKGRMIAGWADRQGRKLWMKPTHYQVLIPPEA